MNRAAVDPVLQERLDTARTQARTPLTRAEVAEIVASVVASMGGEITQQDIKIYAELEALARFIQHAKREIAAIAPADIHAQHIPQATDELDAVVNATEDATNRIMDGCDKIMALSGDVGPEVSSKLMDITTGIYEACNFQDITGQRINKVVKALKHIEGKVETLLVALGEEVQRRSAAEAAPPPEATAPVGDDRLLLHGPQLAGKGVDQAFIDSLFD